MAKRFTSTDIWDEDWFLEMPNEYKLFWYYMLSNCDHAGIFKVNLRSFCSLLEVKVSSIEALRHFNFGKERIRIIADNVWLIEDFFAFQYGEIFNIDNPLHKGVKKQLDAYKIPLESIRGLKDLKLTSKRPQAEDYIGLKDKVKVIQKGGVGENNFQGNGKNKNTVGVSFDESNSYVFFADGSKQELTPAQKEQIANKDISPRHVFKRQDLKPQI